ncbi:MAG: DUF4956 domain-containing protein [Lewinellaceae bacterium]|nr:DUF4956 domain-containing protein [Lewinellaceae bacterium]
MLEEFQQLDVFLPSIFDFAANMFVALFCGLVIAAVYRHTYRGSNYSVSFAQSLVLLCLITAVVILVIGNNLARAFGLVGAMSIIRFRTAVSDVKDIVFIFFSLTIGMAAGVGLNWIAALSTFFICLIVFLLNTTGFAAPDRLRHLLQVSYYDEGGAAKTLQSLLGKYCRKVEIMSVQQPTGEVPVQAQYHLQLRRSIKEDDLLRALRSLEFVEQVNLFFEKEDFAAL